MDSAVAALDGGSEPSDAIEDPEPAFSVEIVVPSGNVRVKSGESVRFEARCDTKRPEYRWSLDGGTPAMGETYEVRLVVPGEHVVEVECTDPSHGATSKAQRLVHVEAGLTLVYQTEFGSPIASELFGVPMADPKQRYLLNPPLSAVGASVREVGYAPDGRWIHHVSELAPGRTELYFRERNGSTPYAASAGIPGYPSDPTFAPSGRYATFVMSQANSDGVWIADLSAAPPHVTRLAGSSWITTQVWSDDSSTVAFAGASNSIHVHRPAAAVKDVEWALPVPGGVRKLLLNRDGTRVAFAVENTPDRRMFAGLSDGSQAALELRCAAGTPVALKAASEQRVLFDCRSSSGDITVACSWQGTDCTGLAEALQVGPRCGTRPILGGRSGIYMLSLDDGSWQPPRKIADREAASAWLVSSAAFNRDCSALFMLDNLAAVAYRIRFAASGASEAPEPVPLPSSSDLRNAKLYPSPQGSRC